MYTTGAVANLKRFEESLRTGNYLNNAAECTDSTLTGILGRKGKRARKKVEGQYSWEEYGQRVIDRLEAISP